MSFSEPEATPPVRCLWLVRHGESTWNARGLVQGQIPFPTLTVLGQRQARQCANRLADEPVGMLVSSDLRRALQTAGPVARALDLQIVEDSRLRERSLGVAEGTLSDCLGPISPVCSRAKSWTPTRRPRVVNPSARCTTGPWPVSRSTYKWAMGTWLSCATEESCGYSLHGWRASVPTPWRGRTWRTRCRSGAR